MVHRAIVDGLFTLPADGSAPHLLVSKCRDCGSLAFPARKRCAACSGVGLDVEQAPAEGTIYSWTVIRELGGPRPDFQPYVIGQVDLAPGLRVQGIVDMDPGRVAIGQRVVTGLIRPFGPDLEADVVTYCFVPVDGGAA